MNKESYIEYSKKNLKGNAKKIMINAINDFYNALENYKVVSHNYNIGD